MRTMTLLHRTRACNVRVPRGPAWTRPARRPKPRPKIGQERLGFDLTALLERSLTATGKRLDRRVVVRALSLTALGKGRSIVSTRDGVLSCDLRIDWEAP